MATGEQRAPGVAGPLAPEQAVGNSADKISATVRHRVAMGHVDIAQIFFAQYFDWFDEALSELLVTIGHPHRASHAKGQNTPIVHIRCDYIAPVYLDDVVETTAWISRCGVSSFDVSYESISAGEPRARARHTHVYMVGEPPLPSSVPEWLRAVVWEGD